MESRDFKGIWIPKEIWLSKELTLHEKIFLVEINSLDNEEGCFASNGYFSEFFGVSKGRCSQIIKQLETKGFIKIDYTVNDTKQIEKRVIKCAPWYVEDGGGVFNKLNGGIKNIKGGIKNIKRGYLENAKDSNTVINNTINNTKNSSGEASSPTSVSSAKKDSKLFSAEKGPDKKVQKWFNHAADIVDAHEFDKSTTEALYKFLEMLSQMNALLPDVTVRAQLNRLSQSEISAVDKCKIVEGTVSRGWKSLDYMLNDHFKSKTASFDTAKNSQNQFYTEEQKKQMREEYKNASEDDLF